MGKGQGQEGHQVKLDAPVFPLEDLVAQVLGNPERRRGAAWWGRPAEGRIVRCLFMFIILTARDVIYWAPVWCGALCQSIMDPIRDS